MNIADRLGETLLERGSIVEVPTWQALDVEGKPQGRTFEICNCIVDCTIDEAVTLEGVNLPWAENQFQERVSGKPWNPGETYKEWPWAKASEEHKPQGKFSHTYGERYYPNPNEFGDKHVGIRYVYGDLDDVVNLLAKQPTTRQAYLPVFFPEDTGAVHGERIPCSLGYLFLMRENKLNITYYIRSCDFYRHFRDDVYMTARLCQWVLEQLVPRKFVDPPHYFSEEQRPEERDYDNPVDPWAKVEVGRLTMHIGSLHVFEGDLPRLRREYGSKRNL